MPVPSPAASRHSGTHSMQPCAVIRQPWPNASRSTDAAASPRPSWIEGRRAKA